MGEAVGLRPGAQFTSPASASAGWGSSGPPTSSTPCAVPETSVMATNANARFSCGTAGQLTDAQGAQIADAVQEAFSWTLPTKARHASESKLSAGPLEVFESRQSTQLDRNRVSTQLPFWPL